MSKEHLFLGKNGLFVSGKRDVFLQWWCFCLPLSWEAEIWPLCVFVTDTWGWLCSGEQHLLVKGSVTQTLEMGGCQHSSFNTHPSDLGLCGQVFGDVF